MVDTSYVDQMRTKLAMKGDTVRATEAAKRLVKVAFYSQAHNIGCPSGVHGRAVDTDLIFFQRQQMHKFLLALLLRCELHICAAISGAVNGFVVKSDRTSNAIK